MTMRNVWEQWDKQEANRLDVELNNTFLQVERGELELTITIANRLRVLVGMMEDDDFGIRDWWMEELQGLPNWNNC